MVFIMALIKCPEGWCFLFLIPEALKDGKYPQLPIEKRGSKGISNFFSDSVNSDFFS